MRIFVSHSTVDRSIAAALQTLFNETFGEENISLTFSSDEEEGGGVPVGKDWLDWITDNIRQADSTLVLVTPNSVNSPWVMWESGLATGVGLGGAEDRRIVPVVFGVRDDKIPSPFNAVQFVQGDAQGIAKLLRDVKQLFQKQGTHFGPIEASIKVNVPEFMATVQGALRETSDPILSTVPNLFNAEMLAGYWVSCFDFGEKCHAEIARVKPLSERAVRIFNNPPPPRTEGHEDNPYRNVIEAEIVNRHLIGYWKNVSDTRYFGTVHLAVNSSDNNMTGHYTGFANDVTVNRGAWTWTRLDPTTIDTADLANFKLRSPREIQEVIAKHLKSGRKLSLELLKEPPQ